MPAITEKKTSRTTMPMASPQRATVRCFMLRAIMPGSVRSVRSFLLALAATLGLAATAHGAEHTITSGGLTVHLTDSPFSIRFVQAQGPTLQQAAGIGYRNPGGAWTRMRSAQVSREGDGLVAAGDGMRLRIAPAGEGILAMTFAADEPAGLEALGAEFATSGSERFLGLGQRASGVNHRGTTVESFVADGPYNPEERPFLQGFVPPAGFRFRDDATYYPVPWLLSTRGYGVLADTTATVYHRLGEPDRWSVEATSHPEGTGRQQAPAELTLRVFAGPRPADVLRRFTAATGRQPAIGARWVWGPWFQGGVEQVKALREADAPVSVAQTYTHYLPCGDHVARREAERKRTADLHALGVAVTTYFNPMLCSDYQPVFDEASAAGALTKTATGQPYLYRYSTSSQFLVGQFDFTSQAGREIYGRLLGEAIGDGHDGWMEDFGEYTPLDSRAADGTSGAANHNLYPVQYHCTAWERVRREPRPVVRFQRSGWTGAAPCAQVVWGGDPTTDWGFDGLRSTVFSGLGMGLSGISTWGSDIGGFFALGARKLTPELLARWIEVGFASGVMRTQRDGIALPEKSRPQVEDPETLPIWRRYAKLRTQLQPYLAAADAEYRRSGLPIMRHLALAFGEDEKAVARDDQFMFGPDLLAAPVLTQGATERALYVPRGRWIDLWRSVAVQPDGSLKAGPARVLEGGREATVPAPLAELPLLVREGAVIPMLPASVRTLYGTKDPVRRSVLAFPGGSTISLPRGRHRYSLQAWVKFRPCRVGTLKRRQWRYSRGVLTASFTSRGRKISLRRC
jgi:alpha-glucosidase (family GH31 glycosyl hydrolase)